MTTIAEWFRGLFARPVGAAQAPVFPADDPDWPAILRAAGFADPLGWAQHIAGAAVLNSTIGQIINCPGFKQRAYGTATGVTPNGSGNVTITHGLGTPCTWAKAAILGTPDRLACRCRASAPQRSWSASTTSPRARTLRAALTMCRGRLLVPAPQSDARAVVL